MMLALFEPAQIDRVTGLILDVKAERVGVERLRAGEVGHAERHMAAAHDVEGWVEDMLRHGHGLNS